MHLIADSRFSAEQFHARLVGPTDAQYYRKGLAGLPRTSVSVSPSALLRANRRSHPVGVIYTWQEGITLFLPASRRPYQLRARCRRIERGMARRPAQRQRAVAAVERSSRCRTSPESRRNRGTLSISCGRRSEACRTPTRRLSVAVECRTRSLRCCVDHRVQTGR